MSNFELRLNSRGMSARESYLKTSPFPWRSYSPPRSNSYPTQASGNGGGAAAAGYQPRRNNPYAQQDDRAYEMSDVRDSRTHLAPAAAPPGAAGDMAAFYAEVRLAPFHLSCLGVGVPDAKPLRFRLSKNPSGHSTTMWLVLAICTHGR